ncbi:MAG: hypothetical protein IJF98_00945 [Firmicutes bacterium]|nr:hypothetical protein [Bacillota bacterium]MBR0105198.1 hypothetical protein [Bacillota bacterium]
MKKLMKFLLLLIIVTMGLSLSACSLKQKTKTYTFHGIAFDIPENWGEGLINEYDMDFGTDCEFIWIYKDRPIGYNIDDIYSSDEKEVFEYILPDGFEITSKEKCTVHGLKAVDYSVEYFGSSPEEYTKYYSYYYHIFIVEANDGIVSIEYTGDKEKPLHEKEFKAITKSIRTA